MKILYIIRHAKSSWKDVLLSDFKRPLNKRGKRDAPLMGSRLQAMAIYPDIIYSSRAKRASDTIKIISKELNYKDEIMFLDDIYEADEGKLHKIIKGINDINSVAFLVGHNPDLNNLAEKYIDFYENIPTCGIVAISFDCDRWFDISSKNSKLMFFDYPKKL